MTAATPTLHQIFLADALVAMARAQKDPCDAHRDLATRRAAALRQMGGFAAVPAADFEQAMGSATAAVELDEQGGGCLCGQCGRRAAA